MITAAVKQVRRILPYLDVKPYFTKSDFVLYHGDSVVVLNQLPENSIDMIFATS